MYAFTAIHGWAEEEDRALTAHIRSHYKRPGLKAWVPRKVVWGKKPE